MAMTKFSRINKQREEITMRVLEDMEKGGNEWKKPWVEASPLPPHNPVSGTQYSGRNFLYTYVYGMMRGYTDPRWATEKQIKEMGWKVPENLQNGHGGINDELGVGIEHWGMYAYIPRVKKGKMFQKTNGFAQQATIRQSSTMSYCIENLKQGRKPDRAIFTNKKRTFRQAFSARKSVVQAVEKFLQKEKLYVKRDTNVPFSAQLEKKALRTAKVYSYPKSILKAQFSMS